MKISLSDQTIKTGGETYGWVETTTGGRVWDRKSKRHRKWHRVEDTKIIRKLAHALDAKLEAREERRHELWVAEERKHAKETSGGVRIYSTDGKQFINVEVSAPDAQGLVNLHLIVAERYHYNLSLDVPEYEVLYEEVSKGRPVD